MTIATRLRQYLQSEGVSYDVVPHPRTATTVGSAHAAHVPGDKVAKTVVVHHELGYVLSVVPSTHRVELGTLQDILIRNLASRPKMSLVASLMIAN
jgi:Ala-tRNA(Pro) deacylase